MNKIKDAMILLMTPVLWIYRQINRRLKLSLTFKITTLYALILSAFLFMIWFSLAAILAISGYFNDDFFPRLIGGLMLIFIMVVFVSIMIGSFTTRKMLRPINHMITTVKSSTSGALYTRLDVVTSYDELKELAETFNGMLDLIQTSYEQQSRFVSDASHELRTPIFVIQSYANLLKRWGKEDEQVLDESIEAITSEIESMKLLIEKLLYLARADNDTQKFEMVRFPLNVLVDEVMKDTRLIDSAHTITNEKNEMLLICGDKGLIKQALRIVIDNSIKYTPDGGSIVINCYKEASWAVLSVADSGLGIAKEDLPFIFDRFYKCDKSRTRESSGSGLGLSIAKWIIDKHEGSISAESEINQGTKMTVRLPISKFLADQT